MRKTLLVIRQELATTFKRPAYVIFAFVIPLLAVLILAGVKFIQGRSGGDGETMTDTPEFQLDVEGYVDQSGLIRVVPQDLSASLLAYADEAQAQQALASGEIAAYYVVPADYVERGEILYVYPPTRALIVDGQEWAMRWTLMVNLLGGDAEAADRVWNPVWGMETTDITLQSPLGSTSADDCSRPGSACESNVLLRYLPTIMVLILYISFMSSSNMLFHSVGSEKENRTLEVVLLSLRPLQMLAGKTIGLGIAGLLQTTAWLGAIAVLLNMGRQTLNLAEDFTFPIHILVWSLVFFVGGYAVYASLMAGAGAMVPKLKEAGAANFIALTPLFAGYAVGLLAPLAGLANGPLPVALSLFPLTAPVVMVMRLTDGMVPLWQLLLSGGLTFATACLILRGAAAMFRAHNLLSGQPFSVRRYFRALLRPAEGSG